MGLGVVQGTFLIPLLFAGMALGQSSANNASRNCTATGDLEIRDFKSTIFHNTRKLRILLPQGYRDAKNAQTKYAVLYLNDGQNLFDVCTAMFGPREWRVDETVARLTTDGAVEPLIVVGIDNAGRHNKERLAVEKVEGSRANEYLPFPDDTLQPPLAEVHGSDYPRFLTQEVMPFIESNYRVKTGPQNTGLGGSSYGGLITLYVAIHTHQVFGRILIESPSLYVSDFAVFKQAEKNKDWPERIYFGAGTDEDTPDPKDSLQAWIVKAVQILESQGVSPDRILTNITPGHHDEDAWGARFPKALAFLFPGTGNHEAHDHR